MALRALWVIPLPGNAATSVLFSRTYPTVERRAKIYGQSEGQNGYAKIPSEAVMYKAIMEELGLNNPSDKFIETRDRCDKKFQKPVFEIVTKEGKFWPVVMIEKYGVLYCCLPLCNSSNSFRPPLIDIPGVSVGFSLLFQMAEVVGPLPRAVNETHPKLQELCCYLAQAAPFGTVIDSNPTMINAAISNHIITQPISARNKQPAWRPVVPKCKPQLHFAITEQIRAVLYNRPDMEDVYQLYGIVTCKAELEGAMPEVTLNLTVPSETPALDNLITHPCVAAADPLNIQPGELTSGVRKFHFNPPTEMFILCHYTATAPPTPDMSTGPVVSPPGGSRPSSVVMARSATPTSISRLSMNSYSSRQAGREAPSRFGVGGGVTPSSERSSERSSSSPTPSQQSLQLTLTTPSELPIRAAYEMRGNEREATFGLRLKLSGNVKNSFEYFEVQIPFFNRGVVVGVDVNPSIGSVVLSQDRHRLGWNLGPKLPSRTLEANLRATVQFAARDKKDDNRDSFCVGLNSYASIYFKVADYTHSGCRVDTRSVQIQPSCKAKITAVREFLSVEYKVWNSQGDALSCLPPVLPET